MRRSSPIRTRRWRARSSRARRASGAPRTGAAIVTSSRPTAPSSRPIVADPTAATSSAIGPAGATDLTSAAYGADRAGLVVVAIERAASNTGTSGPPRTRAVCSSRTMRTRLRRPRSSGRGSIRRRRRPARFVSSIYIDPANANHAWISYSGYNINTPGHPGHVFEVVLTRTRERDVHVARSHHDLADLPVTDLVRDDLTGDLYVSNRLRRHEACRAGRRSWTSAAAGLPAVEVAGLTIIPSERILYAATHGLGAWQLTCRKSSSSSHSS